MPDEHGRLTEKEREIFENLGFIFNPYIMDKANELWPNHNEPGRLAHYTSAESALKIIKAKRLWMRNALCMSDYREVRHGYELLLAERDALNALKTALDECVPNTASESISAFEQRLQEIWQTTYITSMSEHRLEEDGFGRLSMWRAFGDVSPRVAIIFKIARAPSSDSPLGLIFSPVGYFNQKRMRSEIERVTQNVRQRSDFLKTVEPQFIANTVFAMLLVTVTCLKHEGFKEECEWRVIFNPQIMGNHPTVKNAMKSSIESVDGIPQLVFNIPLDSTVHPAATGLEFSTVFDRLIIGPSQYPEPMRQAFITALMEAGVQEPWNKVFASDIPIRT